MSEASSPNSSVDMQTLYVARDYLGPGTFTDLIEGPAVGPHGTLYLVGLGDKRNIAEVVPQPHGHPRPQVFVELPKGSAGNGIRFDKHGDMLVADYTGHNIWRVNMATRKVSLFAHLPGAHQPNDIALAPDGTLYASDPDWANSTGQLWRIRPDGSAKLIMTGMGTTNGIVVSPDGKHLYVDESVQRKVMEFDIQPDGSLSHQRVLLSFGNAGMDGMRCDIKGNLYIARYGAGVVLVVSPTGKILHRVKLKGQKPTNLAFGGPDGRTVYVTLQDTGGVEMLRSKYPGRFFHSS